MQLRSSRGAAATVPARVLSLMRRLLADAPSVDALHQSLLTGGAREGPFRAALARHRACIMDGMPPRAWRASLRRNGVQHSYQIQPDNMASTLCCRCCSAVLRHSRLSRVHSACGSNGLRVVLCRAH